MSSLSMFAAMPHSAWADEHPGAARIPGRRPGELYEWDKDSTYIQEPAVLRDHAGGPPPIKSIKDAACSCSVADSVTTDHISPAGNIKKDFARRARTCSEHGVKPDRLQQLRRASPRQRPGHDPRHVRQHPPRRTSSSRGSRGTPPSICRPASRCRSSTPRSSTRQPRSR